MDTKLTEKALNAAELAGICRHAGADDVGFVNLDHKKLDAQRTSVLEALPWTRSFVVIVRQLNKHTVRVPFRSVSAGEFTEGAQEIKTIVRRISRDLVADGVQAVGYSGFFPMEFGRAQGLPWIVSLKDLAEAAGLGMVGKNRLLLHPRFGANIYIGAVALGAPVNSKKQPAEPSACLKCNMCVTVCPTGAIARDGHFDFSACMTHNYREKLGGFVEWIHTLADSRSRSDYRKRVSDAETVSWWQSLGYEARTHCDYCIAVCPAGAEAETYLKDRKRHFETVVSPLRDRVEPVYVVPGSDAESHVTENYPDKRPRRVGNGMWPDSISTFLTLMPHLFQRGRATGLAARYHFRFRGREVCDATVEIRDNKIVVERGLIGKAALRVTADTDSWLGFISKDRPILRELALGRIRLKGSWRLLVAFGKCFPS